jgi:hypothetical protein
MDSQLIIDLFQVERDPISDVQYAKGLCHPAVEGTCQHMYNSLTPQVPSTSPLQLLPVTTSGSQGGWH